MLNIYDILAVVYKVLDKTIIIMVWFSLLGMSVLMWYFVYSFILTN